MSEHAKPNENHILTQAEKHAIHREKMTAQDKRKALRLQQHRERKFERSAPPCVLI